MATKKLHDIKEFLSKSRNIVLVTHWSPDGDAMGSSLGLYNFLLKEKHKVKVITPNDYPAFLSWMQGNDKVINYSKSAGRAKAAVDKAELICCLDFNSLHRIDELGDYVEHSKAKKLIIDHHPQPGDFADYMLHDVKACSTAELIFDFIEILGEKSAITPEIANCLYTGIMTDTGSFRFPSTTSKTHRIVAELIDAGAENAAVYNRVNDDNTEDKVRLLGYCLSEKLTVLPEYNTAFISLSEDELQRYNYQKGDTEGTVNYALGIRGILFSAFIVERDGMVKLSFRSKGAFDVNKFARKNFEGGGHKNAAGGKSELSLDETILKFIKVLSQYKKRLNSLSQ